VRHSISPKDRQKAKNGYEIIRGKRLKALKLVVEEADHPETDFGIIKKTARLGVFLIIG
jgi:hypothetical protein